MATNSSNFDYYFDMLVNMFPKGNMSGLKECDEYHLDPFSTMIRLYILSRLPEFTKLGFSQFTITFDKPSILQYTIRRLKRSKKDDIAILKPTIIKFLRNYNLQHPYIRSIAEGSIKGLKKLQLCYSTTKDRPISDCIDYYIRLVKDGLAGNLSQSMFISPSRLDLLKSESKYELSSLESKVETVSPDTDNVSPNTDTDVDIDAETNTEVKQNNDNDDDNDDHHHQKEEKSTSSINDVFIETGDKSMKIFKKLWSNSEINIVYASYMELQNADDEKVDEEIELMNMRLAFKDKTLYNLIIL